MLNGDMGYPAQKSMQILQALGNAFGAEKMVKIRTAHLPGVSIEVAGEAGAQFLESMADKGGKFSVYTTTNIASIDFDQWDQLGILPEDQRLQLRMSRACQGMGALLHHSCIPYELGHVPRLGDHVAWGESSAVMYINSVLGARTNKEGGPSALAAAITGRVPAYGAHLTENRRATVVVRITTSLRGLTDYGSLGYWAGKQAKQSIVVFDGMDRNVSNEELKFLSASLSSSSAAFMFHAVGVTPEAATLEQALGGMEPERVLEFGERELTQTRRHLDRDSDSALDWIVIGCPHVSVDEIRQAAELLDGKKLHSNVSMWILTSAMIKQFAVRNGYADRIEQSGAKIVTDTCPVVMTHGTLNNLPFRTLATNSAKLVNCMPGGGFAIHYGDLEQLIRAGINGTWRCE